MDALELAESRGRNDKIVVPDFINEVMGATNEVISAANEVITAKRNSWSAPEPKWQLSSSSTPANVRHSIEESLYPRTSTPGYLAAGAFTGAAVGAAKHAFKGFPLYSESLAARLGQAASPTLAGEIGLGAAKGLGIAGASLAAGYAIDTLGSKVFGYKQPQVRGLAQTLLDGVAVPSILLSSMPARAKIGLASVTFVAARAGDLLDGTQASTSMSRLMRPNTADAVLVTAAALAPVDGRTKAMLVGGAYLVGRAYNELAYRTGLDGARPNELRDASNNAFSRDLLSRTVQSFENTIEKGKALGRENEGALELQMRDWLDKQSTTARVTHLRGSAELASALGQFRLETGTRLDPTSHVDTKERILKDFKYDFGGEATAFLRMSAGSLVNAQNEVLKHKGETIDGQIMDDAYLTQLKYLQTQVEKQLDAVYGPHDMNGIFNELSSLNPAQTWDLQKALMSLENRLQVTASTQDKNFVAKQHRDLSLGYLVVASRLAPRDPLGALIMYGGATEHLQASQALVGKQLSDNQGLEKIQLEVAKKMPALVDQALLEVEKKMPAMIGRAKKDYIEKQKKN